MCITSLLSTYRDSHSLAAWSDTSQRFSLFLSLSLMMSLSVFFLFFLSLTASLFHFLYCFLSVSFISEGIDAHLRWGWGWHRGDSLCPASLPVSAQCAVRRQTQTTLSLCTYERQTARFFPHRVMRSRRGMCVCVHADTKSVYTPTGVDDSSLFHWPFIVIGIISCEDKLPHAWHEPYWVSVTQM